MTSASRDVTCPDGHEERIQLFGWSWHLVDDTHPRTREEEEHAHKRLLTRAREIGAAWPCQDRPTDPPRE